MTHHTLYTREQADQVLPLVRAIAEDQREVYLRVRSALAALGATDALEEISGDHRLPAGVLDDLAELRGYVLELDELGAKMSDPEIGLVTFRGLYGGEVVNLCWKLGEDRVRFYFPQGATYAARRPLGPVPA